MTLSTHVLDTSTGLPAAGVRIELRREGVHVTTAFTNADGRTDGPLLPSEELTPGLYELTFHAGAYFRNQRVSMPNPPFLDEIVIRFGISESTRNYHVPLLLSPYGYSTYRGS